MLLLQTREKPGSLGVEGHKQRETTLTIAIKLLTINKIKTKNIPGL
jgi:hypothetical protein